MFGMRMGRMGGGGALPLDIDAAVLISRMTTPPAPDRAAAINTMITSLKGAGIWSKLDSFQVYAAKDAQSALLDWVNPTRVATSAADFIENVGFRTTGANVVNMGFSPSSPGLLQSINDVTFGFYSTTGETTNTTSHGGAWDGTTGITIAPRTNDGAASFRVNQFQVHPAGVQNFSPTGLWSVVRSGAEAANSSMWQNGTFRSGNNFGSLAVPTTNFVLGGITTSGGTTKTYNAAYSGKALSGTEIGLVNTILRAFLTSIAGLGPELLTNPDFLNGLTGWSDVSSAPSNVTVSNGIATFNVSGANAARLRQSITVAAGATYLVTIAGTILGASGVAIGTTAGGTELSAFGSAASRTVTPPGTTLWINTSTGTDGVTLDSVSVKRIG